ncbi:MULTISPECIES: sn-glycerol-3-phosphate ABC transporter ATP-binding protein UgpC [unclassified Pseudodesulfovibrio]|uniref:ABC transporter ATP-binding protein n=1 Tax=unclassified Pseudodesulfovibrio TaxID=2661612 RepID=UPI000FEB871B|nr:MULTISPECIES: sn-glycerol-3-phosphate ABC transporter ATP-binding protein UgpC [unclassified Pseudodesulfovibrio]MCJ2164413.1 sn-glycerol-3-phosphate ABC transporter ATP-binding protein UgpC [Pseudodesulfovibrio sp. S3-i]RWU04619.1 sn-glycerol-3-phosphate ABC transporter ATP-binding protein UgpC [Pseudodesulfovibrio sp. S3]
MANVQLRKVVKRFGDVEVVHGIDLDIMDSEFIVLVGPSGCGKSTVLRMIAGLEVISSGEISIGDRVVNQVSPKDRNVAMVFQNYALYPHMSVRENMGFSLKMRKESVADIETKVDEAARILELEPYLDRKPSELSGGQRQRVAMGRALVRSPDVFLFDEPLSNLDAQLRTQMRMELRKMHLRLSTTTVYVTHDQIEAMTLADRIVILKDGYIQQVGTPIEVFEQPDNVFVAQFIGNPPMNILEGTFRVLDGKRCVEVGKSRFPVTDGKAEALTDGAPVLAGLRPDSIKMGEGIEKLPKDWWCQGEVVVSEILGGHSHLEIVIDGENDLLAEVEGRVIAHPGEVVPIGFEFDRMVLFDPETTLAIR